MVQIVPDDYFPPDEEAEERDVGATTSATTVTDAATPTTKLDGHVPPLASSTQTRLFEFGVERNEAFCAAVDAVTSLMKAGDLEAACSLVEQNGFHLDLVAVNGTLLANGVNIMIGILVKPLYGLVLGMQKYFTTAGIGAALRYMLPGSANATSSSTGAAASRVPNSGNAADTPLSLFGVNLLSFEATWKRGVEAAMVLFCVVICILMLLVRYRFAKYFHELDVQVAQDSGATACIRGMKSRKLQRRFEPMTFCSNEECDMQEQQKLPPVMENGKESEDESPSALSTTM